MSSLEEVIFSAQEELNAREKALQSVKAPEFTISKSREIDSIRLIRKFLANIVLNLPLLEAASIDLRPNQSNAIQSLIDHLTGSFESGYFQQPTGAGKTVLMGAISRLLGVKTLILVPKVNLVDQTKDELVERLGFSAEDIGMIYQGVCETGRQVTISTYQSHISRYGNLPEDYVDIELIICDEAHKSLGDRTQDAIDGVSTWEGNDLTEKEEDFEAEFMRASENFISGQALVLAFTATPELRQKSVRDKFGKCIAKVTYAELIKTGILKQIKLIQIASEIDEDDLPSSMTEDEEVKILERVHVYDRLLDEYEEFVTGNMSDEVLNTGVFCANIHECEVFERKAAERGYRSIIVTSRIGANRLQEAEEKLQKGDINFIITVEKLSEGWNFPALNAVMLARATESPVRILQPIGRGMRSFIGQKFCYVFEMTWSVRRSGGNGGSGVSTSTKASTDDEIHLGRKTMKALTIAQAFADLGENPELICHTLDGGLPEYMKTVLLDENGCGELILNRESIQVIGSNSAAADFFGLPYDAFYKLVVKSDIQNLGVGSQSKSGRAFGMRCYVYPLDEVSQLIESLKAEVQLDDEGCAWTEIEGELVRLTSRTTAAGEHFGMTRIIYFNRLDKFVKNGNLKVQGTAKSRHVEVSLFLYSEVEELLADERNAIKLDSNGCGEITSGDEKMKVVAPVLSAIDQFDVSYRHFVRIISAATEKGEITPVGHTFSRGRKIPVYPIKEVEALFSLEQNIELDENGMTLLRDESGETRLIGVTSSAAAYLSQVLGVSITYQQLKRGLESSELCPQGQSTHRAREVNLYEIQEVLALFRNEANLIDLDKDGFGTINIEDGNIEVVGLSKGSARALGVSIDFLRMRISEAVEDGTLNSCGKGKLRRSETLVYPADDVRSLITNEIQLEEDGTVLLRDGTRLLFICKATAEYHFGLSLNQLNRLLSLHDVKARSEKATLGKVRTNLYSFEEVKAVVESVNRIDDHGFCNITVGVQVVRTFAVSTKTATTLGTSYSRLKKRVEGHSPVSWAYSGPREVELYSVDLLEEWDKGKK